MPPAILSPHTCGTCPFKERAPGGELNCRWGPPSAQAIVVMSPRGPQIVGHVKVFPVVLPEDWCYRHPSRVAPTLVMN